MVGRMSSLNVERRGGKGIRYGREFEIGGGGKKRLLERRIDHLVVWAIESASDIFDPGVEAHLGGKRIEEKKKKRQPRGRKSSICGGFMVMSKEGSVHQTVRRGNMKNTSLNVIGHKKLAGTKNVEKKVSFLRRNRGHTGPKKNLQLEMASAPVWARTNLRVGGIQRGTVQQRAAWENGDRGSMAR